MTRPKIADQHNDGHFGYGELLSPASVDALITQHNEHATALDAIESGSASLSGNFQELRLSPIGPWYEVPEANLPAGVINNYVHPSMATHTVLTVRGADNNGTILSGMDSSGVAAGDLRVLFNTGSTSGIDVGTILLKHQDTGSFAANRFELPGFYDHIIPIGGSAVLLYGDDSRWHVLAAGGWQTKTITQSLQLYPSMRVGRDTPISGTFNDWNPVGYAPYGPGYWLAGSDATFKNHSLIIVHTDAAGATITGLAESNVTAPTDWGPIKIFQNQGPGRLTFKHQNIGSDAKSRMNLPRAQDVVLDVNETITMVFPALNPDGTPQWWCIGTGQSANYLDSATVTDRTSTRQFSLTTKDAPAQLSKHTSKTNNWNPGSSVCAGANTHNDGSFLTGIVPTLALTFGEIRYVTNVGTGPLALLPGDTGSDAENRFVLPGGRPMVLVTRDTVQLRHDEAGNWNAITYRDIPNAVSITPAALAGSNINNYNPTDSSTGWPGRLATIWRIQGQVGTALTGIEVSPSGLPSFIAGDRIQLINYGGSMLIKHQDANSSAANRITCPPGGANNPDYTLLGTASVWLILDASGSNWIVEGARV